MDLLAHSLCSRCGKVHTLDDFCKELLLRCNPVAVDSAAIILHQVWTTCLVSDVNHKCPNLWLIVIHLYVLRQDCHSYTDLMWYKLNGGWSWSDAILLLLRRREHHLSVSAGTRRTPCAVVAGPKLTIFRNPPVASVATLRNARESVSSHIKRVGCVWSVNWERDLGGCSGQFTKSVVGATVLVDLFIFNWLLVQILAWQRKFPSLSDWFSSVDNWSAKAKRRNTTGTGRLRHLKVVYRRFR